MRINGGIGAETVRLIDQSDNQVGVVSKIQALTMAQDIGLDLVEVAPTSDPPVCRIMDYGKWLYQQKRKVREAHKKTQRHAGTLKEVRLRPETDKHDVAIKVNHAREFIQKGHKVQFTLFFRGRQMLHKELGYQMLEHIFQVMQDVAQIERPSAITGKRMTLLLVPK